jgi:threonine synthase
VQRRQMTTPIESNVHAIAVEGDFDDCQACVKDMFNDFDFRDGVRLAGVNSINWARVLAQVVYYFSSALSLGAPDRAVSFTVPTGNFGDIFAGYIARKMGLPIEKLVIATNQNNILHRAIATGAYKTDGVRPSISPSMDIQVSSNFERVLYDACGEDGAAVVALMADLKAGGFSLEQGSLDFLREAFASGDCSEAETLASIAHSYASTGALPPFRRGRACGSRVFGSNSNDHFGHCAPSKIPRCSSKSYRTAPCAASAHGGLV